MIQKNKELLLKDLCARSLYNTRVSLKYEHKHLEGTLIAVYPIEDDRVIIDDLSEAIAYYDVRCGGFHIKENNIKPYLFPLSSMTEEQKKDIFRNGTFFFDRHNTLCRFPKHNDDYDYATFEDHLEITEKLNKNHFDYRGLIEKGLAIDAT